MSTGIGSLFGLFTALKEILGIASDAKQASDEIRQQTGGGEFSYADEAIQIGLDIALATLFGQEYLYAVTQVRASLENHQKKDWRMALVNLSLTEKFENQVKSVKEVHTGASQKGPERTERFAEFERRITDYEYTELDPRVRHLALIGYLVFTPGGGVEVAKQYLLDSGYIRAKSRAQEAAETIERGKDAVFRTIEQLTAEIFLDAATIEGITASCPAPEKGASSEAFKEWHTRLNKLLEEALREETQKTRVRTAKAKKNRVSFGNRIGIALGVIVIMILIWLNHQ